jgi:hypothetical protein
MVTKINRDVPSKNNEGSETKDVMAGRTAKLVSTACKLSLEANSAKRAAFAAAMAFGLLHGELRYMNDLYKGLSREDQEAMRIFAIGELAAQFDPEAEREINEDGTDGKWKVRPANFLTFKATPKDGADHIAWFDIKAKDNDSVAILEGKRRAKQTKQAATKALKAHGETVLAFEWVSNANRGVVGTPFDAKRFVTGLVSLLKKGAMLEGKSWDEIRKIALAAGLEAGTIKDIEDVWMKAHKPKSDSDNKPVAKQEDNEGERKVA